MQFTSNQFSSTGLLCALPLTLALIAGCASKQPAPPAPAAKPTTVVSQAPAQPTPVSAAPAAPAVAPAPSVVATPAPAPAPAAAPATPITLKAEAGLLRCEDGVTVSVKRIMDDGAKIVVAMKGTKDTEMTRVTTESGALRYESKATNQALIYVVGRTFMLDTKRGSRVANDCKL